MLWKRCADAPVEMTVAQAVVMGEKVYVGGGVTEKQGDKFHVFQYTTTRDEWSRLPPHNVCYFAMAQFTGRLITVGGMTQVGGSTGKVYRFKEESKEWVESLKPMTTARYFLSVATTQSTIITSGGETGVRDGKSVVCATVEVYRSETSQWYTAEPLPFSCYRMTSIILADTYYLQGGNGADDEPIPTVLYTPLTSFIQKAISPTPRQSSSSTSFWDFLPNTPLLRSAATSLSGSLLTVGGDESGMDLLSSAVYVFLPFTNSWIGVADGNLPEARHKSTAVQLSSNRMIVIGGTDNDKKKTRTVFAGTLTV